MSDRMLRGVGILREVKRIMPSDIRTYGRILILIHRYARFRFGSTLQDFAQ